jgi:hypothetical protein
MLANGGIIQPDLVSRRGGVSKLEVRQESNKGNWLPSYFSMRVLTFTLPERTRLWDIQYADHETDPTKDTR